MTYTTGGNIQAIDYNTFATLSSSMNELFADLHPGATTLAAGADFGYGQTPALITRAAGDAVSASEWAALFQSIRKCGQHQNTSVVPPLPGTSPGFTPNIPADSNLVTNPVTGGAIVAHNTPTTLSSLISTLRTNRHNVDPAQFSYIAGSVQTGTGTWLSSLTYTFQVNFGSWNNARYFFNSGGKISITGSYAAAVSPVELIYRNILQNNFPVNISWSTTESTAGINLGSEIVGFYGLDTGYAEIYKSFLGGAYYYTTSYIAVEARLAGAAGTSGIVDFRVRLVDNDPTLDSKAGSVSFQINNIRSAGAITYPGSVTIVNGGFTYNT